MLDRTSSRRDPRRVHAVVPCCTDATTTPTDRVARAARVPGVSRARDPFPPSMDFDITTSRPRARAPGRPGAPASAHRPDAPSDPEISPADLPLTVRVSNVSPLVDEPTLREFLECCGPLRRLARAPPRDGASRFLATFATQDAARAAARAPRRHHHRQNHTHPPGSVPEFEPPRRRARHSGRRRRRRRAPRRRRRRRRPVRDARRETRRRSSTRRRDDAARMDPLELYRAARELLPSYFSEGFGGARCSSPCRIWCSPLAARRRRESPRRATTM